MDWNIQVDVRSARHVIENSNPVLIPLTVTVETSLQRAHLGALKQAGAFGQLIAQQAEAFAVDQQNEKRFGELYAGLPEDFINFLHDPLACAIALGYRDGIEISEISIILEEQSGSLHERLHPDGKVLRIVTKVDGPRFGDFWLNQMLKR